jgi:pimeloyl-ACP methyl ester carboxylesterase
MRIACNVSCVLFLAFSFVGIGATSAHAATSPTMVVIIPGMGMGTAPYVPMATALQAEGYEVRVLDLAGQNLGADAAVIGRNVDSLRAENPNRKVALVGHSVGGLSARHYLKVRGGHQKVSTYIAIGTAQYGVSRTCDDLPEFACFESRFLNELNDGIDTPGPTRYYSIRVDNEYADGRLDGQQCRMRPSPGLPIIDSSLQHTLAPVNPEVIGAVSSALAGRCADAPVSDPDKAFTPESTILHR